MLFLIGIIVLRVVPAFSEFYSQFGKELPLSTRIIVGISNTVVGNFPIIVIGVIAGVVALVSWWKRPGQHTRVDRWLLQLPWAGETVRKFATAQLARTLATLLGGGIPLVNALEIGGRAMTNRYLALELGEVSQRVREGESFAAALLARGVLRMSPSRWWKSGEIDGARLQEC